MATPTTYDQIARLIAHYDLEFGMTVKPASPREARPKAKARGISRERVERRTATAAILELFDREEPRRAPVKVPGLGALVRRGYLKQRGDGYIRTAKPFYLDPTRQA